MAARSRPKMARDAVRPPAAAPGEWWWGVALAVAVLVVYLPVLRAGFVWDDASVVTSNPVIVGPAGLAEIWTTKAADICPLTLSVFWLEHQLWGLRPLPYHLVNVLEHAASAVLFWRVLLALRIPGAWLGAAIWALHPVQVESVAWVSEMKNTQSGVFFLLASLFFVKSLGRDKAETRNYALTLSFAALAMASKTSTITLPLVLALAAWWIEGRWRWQTALKLTPVFLLSLVAAGLSLWTQLMPGANDPQWERSFPQRIAAGGDAVWFYLAKLLWPQPILPVYPRWHVDGAAVISYLPLAAVVVVFAVLWARCDSWARPWFFAFAFFLAALLPVLGFVDNSFSRYSFVADHFQYLASMAPLALIGAGFGCIAMPWRAIAGGAVALLLAALSYRQTFVWENEESVWKFTVARNPGCWIGLCNLGSALAQRGEAVEAADLCQRALAINPHYAEAHDNLGFALFQLGRDNEAVAEYRQALAISPDFAAAYSNLGVISSKAKRWDEAIDLFRKAIAIDPAYAEAHFNLGATLIHERRWDEAIAELQTALSLNPGQTQAHNDLGVAYANEGRIDEALAQFQAALQVDPANASALDNLAKVRAQQGSGVK